MQAIIEPDWLPYGIEQNRPSIEALLQYAHEHGLTSRRIKLEELFAPSTMRDIPLGWAADLGTDDTLGVPKSGGQRTVPR